MYPLCTTQPVYMRLHYVATYEPKDGYPLTKATNRRVPTNLVRARMSPMGAGTRGRRAGPASLKLTLVPQLFYILE